jgi:hypothetical protein
MNTMYDHVQFFARRSNDYLGVHKGFAPCTAWGRIGCMSRNGV